MNDSILDVVLGGGIPYITYAVPLFFVFIGVEKWVERRQGARLYQLGDSLADLSCGIVSQMGGLLIKGFTFAAYVLLWERFALVDVAGLSVAGKWTAAVALFIGVDFFYYWFHRASHEVNFLWAAHIVHHHSEEYNLAVALRQSVFQGWFSWVFYLPLAILGFPPVWFVSMAAFNTLYQFWIHSRAIPHLGLWESFINTASHHRVHHGKNPRYLDRNHGGTLIIWDKLFGTFEPEGEPVVYGTTRELQSYNPVWSNLSEWEALWRESRAYPRWQDRVQVWFRPPGWHPAGVVPKILPAELTPETQIKYAPHVPRGRMRYALAHFVLSLVVGAGVLVLEPVMGVPAVLPLAAWVVVALLSVGGVLEDRPFARWLEPVRLVALVALTVAYLRESPALLPAAAAVGAVVALSVGWRIAQGRPAPVPALEAHPVVSAGPRER